MRLISNRLLTPSMLVACLALIVALGGVGYAAGVLPKNSVGAAQLQRKAVTSAKIKKNAVTGTKVRNGSLSAADFKAGQLPAGPQGPKGDPGPRGPKGDPGQAGAPGGILPSKHTVRGYYASDFHAEYAGHFGFTAISFGASLSAPPAAPKENFIPAGHGPTVRCPGSVDDPQAAPGNLCVYQSVENNAEAARIVRLGSVGQVTFDAASRYGAALYTSAFAAGSVSNSGTWAATAP